MSDKTQVDRGSDRWAQLRFAIVGVLLAAPPDRGELRAVIARLASRQWTHPTTAEPTTFAFSTIEGWFYQVRNEHRDPVGKLKRRVRKDAGTHPSMGLELIQALEAQYRDHPSWSYQLHADNLQSRARKHAALSRCPSYETVRRFMQGRGWTKRKRLKHRETPGMERALEKLEKREIRSFEAAFVMGLWHLDFHEGSRKVVTPEAVWMTPQFLGILDDRSRLACHLQWYLDETADALVHGYSQAIQKRGLPRATMTDGGSAMRSGEFKKGIKVLGIQHDTTLPYSPYQNGKQENFWSTVEGRLMAMLEGVEELTLELLNEATQAWVEGDAGLRRAGIQPRGPFRDRGSSTGTVPRGSQRGSRQSIQLGVETGFPGGGVAIAAQKRRDHLLEGSPVRGSVSIPASQADPRLLRELGLAHGGPRRSAHGSRRLPPLSTGQDRQRRRDPTDPSGSWLPGDTHSGVDGGRLRHGAPARGVDGGVLRDRSSPGIHPEIGSRR